MRNWIVILVISYSISVESMPQNRNEGNITTIRTSQNSEYVTKAARNDDFNTFWGSSLPSVLKKVSEFGANDKDAVIVYKPSLPDDFVAFWGSNLTDTLQKVSKFRESDRDAVIVNESEVPRDLKASPSSYSNEDGVNNENNNQQATDDPEDYHPFQDVSGLGTDDNDTYSEEEWDADYNPADYESEEDVTEQNEAKSNYYKENNHTTPGPDEAEKNMKIMQKNSANKINNAFGSTYVILCLMLTIQFYRILD